MVEQDFQAIDPITRLILNHYCCYSDLFDLSSVLNPKVCLVVANFTGSGVGAADSVGDSDFLLG